MSQLERQHVRALRNADHLVLYMNVPQYRGGEPANWIKAIVDADNSPTGFEQQQIIPLESARVTNLEADSPTGTDHSDYPLTGLTAAELRGAVGLHNARHSELTRTWVELVRPGDSLELHLLTGVQSECLEQAHLIREDARLTIKRPAKRGTRRMTFLLASYVVPPHSLARMVTKAR